ncbi:hypothetical protein PDE_00467 [Penicillium oxalicum 114-2]|uniref:Uncharacterized protein n=1 Tax=Penicillium oxalicum (strain 114-2 / CGMCC 5302) TaxID=933388 RepID=S7Z5Y4_PENO1|nr:hypothetical protein PDE_00467 [Penicillium oxalicum 114-2]
MNGQLCATKLQIRSYLALLGSAQKRGDLSLR